MTTIRLFFKKKDRAKYISHLDIVRCFSRAISRAKLPIWYTEGYNPKIYMAFFLPLPLGFEGEMESFDIRLIDDSYSLEMVKEKLNGILPEGIEITRVVTPVSKAEAITTAEYVITMERTEHITEESFGAFTAQEEVIVTKKTKKGDKQMDIRPLFQIVEMKQDEDSVIAKLYVAAGTSLNVNPTLIMNAYFTHCGVEDGEYIVQRNAIFNTEMEEWK